LSAVEETVKYREEHAGENRHDMMQLLVEIKKQGPIVDEESKYETTAFNVPKDDQGRQVLGNSSKLVICGAKIVLGPVSCGLVIFCDKSLLMEQNIRDNLSDKIA